VTARLRTELAWLRVSGASLVLFVLIGAGHVLPALHFALVVHRVCAEHGEVVHEAQRPLERSREPAGAAVSGAAGAGHEHDHCGVPALPGGAAAPPARAWARAEAPHELAAAPNGERSAHVHVALLSYAPKLAPPAPAA
jgi:hypothetical protein